MLKTTFILRIDRWEGKVSHRNFSSPYDTGSPHYTLAVWCAFSVRAWYQIDPVGPKAEIMISVWLLLEKPRTSHCDYIIGSRQLFIQYWAELTQLCKTLKIKRLGSIIIVYQLNRSTFFCPKANKLSFMFFLLHKKNFFGVAQPVV